MVTKTEVSKRDVEEMLGCDQVTLSKGVFTARLGFSDTLGRTADNFAAVIHEAFPEAVILDTGEVWKPFKSEASIARQSHWFVRFSFAPNGPPS